MKQLYKLLCMVVIITTCHAHETDSVDKLLAAAQNKAHEIIDTGAQKVDETLTATNVAVNKIITRTKDATGTAQNITLSLWQKTKNRVANTLTLYAKDAGKSKPVQGFLALAPVKKFLETTAYKAVVNNYKKEVTAVVITLAAAFFAAYQWGKYKGHQPETSL